MSYRYRKPTNVLSPRDAVSKVDLLFDNGIYSVAKLMWYGEEKLGIRWNIGLREWDDPAKASGLKNVLEFQLLGVIPLGLYYLMILLMQHLIF